MGWARTGLTQQPGRSVVDDDIQLRRCPDSQVGSCRLASDYALRTVRSDRTRLDMGRDSAGRYGTPYPPDSPG